MESLVVHSKAFVIKWITVPDNTSVRWELKTNKKSINFGIFRKIRGNDENLSSRLSAIGPSESVSSSSQPQNESANSSSSTASTQTLDERLKQSGLHPVYLHGRCQAHAVLKGSYTVASGSGGMFAFVFDNTFSKTLSKTVQFSHSVVPVKDAQLKAGISTTTAPRQASLRRMKSSHSNHSSSKISASHGPQFPVLIAPTEADTRYFDGVLLKKRRKKLQGYAKRYFTLDNATGMLSYYHDFSSSVLRGSIPVQDAAVSVKVRTREIFIDSGAEIWNLRATTHDDFDSWKQALELARSSKADSHLVRITSPLPLSPVVSPLIGLNKDAVKYDSMSSKLNQALQLVKRLRSQVTTPGSYNTDESAGYFGLEARPDLHPQDSSLSQGTRRNPFRRRRSTHTSSHTPTPTTPTEIISRAYAETIESLERVLQQATSEFSILATDSRRMSMSIVRPKSPRSVDNVSIHSEPEFFDAQEMIGVLVLPDNGEVEDDIVIVSDDEDDDEDEGSTHAAAFKRLSSISSSSTMSGLKVPLSPNASAIHDLYPLPIESPTHRRETVPPNAVAPPSLIQFVRKNVGKDLSTVAMPVTANEPLSLLQRYAESLEYSMLLDDAAKANVESGEQILYVAAFAISYLSNVRSKERASRKPFNPLLNETFELVREDRGFRFLAEKISHRPPIMATYAESKNWTYSYCPQPSQKFWGKSAEIISEGPITIGIAGRDEVVTSYTYTMPTTYLRNMLAGEKYIEPSGQVTVVASSGHRAVIEFKAKSMFSAQRSEEVVVQVFAPQHNNPLPIGLTGEWTKELIRTSDKKKIWTVGELLSDPKARYGMTEFCAPLNEITSVEANKLAPSDSRFRPDQRSLENGKIEEAEKLKKTVEEIQRDKRKSGKIPAEGASAIWFEKVENSMWVPVQGEQGYWESRRRGDWSACPKLW
ncbi:Oxysterol-binding protein-domain-containing protein [Lipomyces arxii]|uniref:Oxysterol-binding protein-domain-containing protein n=1 Tax=Lipomyces arxii TaxID=56418 RepID=UPI0034CEC4FF